MAASLERTCWRGVRVDHPPEWEVAVASGLDEPGRLILADRLYHRLDLRWRSLKYVPNMDLMLTKYKRRSKKDPTRISELKTAPAPWKGMVHKKSEATIVHAGRFFRPARLLVEATIVWPGRRDLSMEQRVLDSVQGVDPDATTRLWQAMGLSVTCPADLELREGDLQVGRIQWEFSPKGAAGRKAKRGPHLRVERIAMPDGWLAGRALREWLDEEVPPGLRQLRSRVAPQGPHSAEEIISAGKAPVLRRLLGYRRLRLDLAWRCPTENRVYHVSLSELRRDEEIALPGQWEVRCCRPVPAVGASRNAG